jgi:hypothetical protein
VGREKKNERLEKDKKLFLVNALMQNDLFKAWHMDVLQEIKTASNINYRTLTHTNLERNRQSLYDIMDSVESGFSIHRTFDEEEFSTIHFIYVSFQTLKKQPTAELKSPSVILCRQIDGQTYPNPIKEYVVTGRVVWSIEADSLRLEIKQKTHLRLDTLTNCTSLGLYQST